MNITISCNPAHGNKNFTAMQKLYKQLEEFASTRIDNPLYALCFEKFAYKMNADMFQTILTNTTTDENDYITINLSNEFFEQRFFE